MHLFGIYLFILNRRHHILQLLKVALLTLSCQEWGCGAHRFKPRLNVLFKVTLLRCKMRGANSFLQGEGEREAYLLHCQTLTSLRRQRRDVHPECFPPAPKCCTYVTTTDRRGVWRHTDTHWETIICQCAKTRAPDTFIRAISLCSLCNYRLRSRTVTHGELSHC